MRRSVLSILLALSVVTLSARTAFADSFEIFSQPTGDYTSQTTDYGAGGDVQTGINNVGIFSFPHYMYAETVNDEDWFQPWGSPPAVENAWPDVLFQGVPRGEQINVNAPVNTVGFEVATESQSTAQISASFFDEHGNLIDTVVVYSDANGDAQVIGLHDTTPGQTIGSVFVSDNLYVGDSGSLLAFAQLRAGEINPTPEPGTLALLGSGLLGLAGMIRRKIKA